MDFKSFKDEYKKLSTDSEREKFINSRIYELISSSSQERIGKNIIGSYDGFISPDIGISSNESSVFSDLSMDDLDIYSEFMNFINNDVDTFLRGEPSTIINIQKFIWNYFGANTDIIFGRMDVYSDDPGELLSVKKLKGRNIAACSERSAMVQNLLKFLGFDSEILFGKLNDRGSHAYIIFKAGNGKYRILYDPMNPVLYKENGRENWAIGVSIVKEEEYIKLKNGESYKFEYDLVKKLYGEEKDYIEEERKYSSDDILFSENQSNMKRSMI